jgi:hypothetical protein
VAHSATPASETDPNQAWIQLVSALEIAAGTYRAEKRKPLERIKLAWPELAELMERVDGHTAESIARVVAPVVRSTVAFLDFMSAFCPIHLLLDPKDGQRYTDQDVQHIFEIYGYRSRALHAGTPFPAPMCERPYRLDDGTYAERPPGLSSWAQDAVWNAEDVPMLLATFEEIAHGALLLWWHHMATTGA